MKCLMLAGGLVLAGTAVSLGDGSYWVVGNRANRKCDIVTSNPVIYGLPAFDGGYWFGDGPYRSRDDAKLARSTVSACPKDDTGEK